MLLEQSEASITRCNYALTASREIITNNNNKMRLSNHIAHSTRNAGTFYFFYLFVIFSFFLFSTIFFGCFACDNKYVFSLNNTHLFYSDHIFFSCFICQFAEYCIIISNDYDVDIRLDWVRSARTRGKCMYTMRRHAISTHCEHIAHKQSVQSSTSSVAIHTPNATRTRFYLHFAVLATCENLMVMGDGNAYGDHWRAIMRSSK